MIYRLEKVSFSYNNHKVLDIDSLFIEEGKIYSLFGANGSGKTTLLKILNGLLRVKTGSVYFNNEPIELDKYKKVRANTVYVHQNPLLLTGTVSSNIAYGLKIRKKSKETINRITKEMVDLAGLSGFENRKSRELSVGESKRVAIARALAIAPRVLLLDEPTAHIDKNSIERIYETLKEINKSQNTTIILSSHDESFSKKIADKIFHIENGEIIK